MELKGLNQHDKASSSQKEFFTMNNKEEKIVRLLVDGQITLSGNLFIPKNPKGMVVFAHGGGSSRQSPRNKYVAQILQDAGISTLLIDLLTEEEEDLLQLVAAAQRQKIVKAIVSRGGRPDLAGPASLSRVQTRSS